MSAILHADSVSKIKDDISRDTKKMGLIVKDPKKNMGSFFLMKKSGSNKRFIHINRSLS